MCIDREGIAKEHLPIIIDSESKKGANIAEEILQVLWNAHINEEKLAFQCYDFVNNMSGHFNGIQVHILKKLGRNIKTFVVVNCHKE